MMLIVKSEKFKRVSFYIERDVSYYFPVKFATQNIAGKWKLYDYM